MNNVAEVLPLGPDGVLVRFSDQLSEPANRAALAFRARMEHAGIDGVVETATSLTSAYFRFRPDVLRRAALEDHLKDALSDRDWLSEPLPEGRHLWRVPATFGGAEGPQLDESAALAGVSPEVAVEQLCAAPLRVLALGFAPGQPYLGFLPEHWNISRQSDVTPEVPRGAVVVAVRQVIPFANAAPTGWRQIGRTAFRCHDPALDPAIPLKPGDEMCFEPVDAARLSRFQDEATPYGGAEKVALA